MRKNTNTFLNLLQKIDAEGGISTCWPYTGYKTLNGYGHIRCGSRKTIKAHRWAYEYFYGKAPERFQVLHLCDNRLCCNPTHLKLGTHAENMEDMKNKGRKRSLCYETIKELRRNGLTHKAIAEQLNCSPHTVQQILKNQVSILLE